MRVSACLFVKNESRQLAEWIAYHLEIGIDEIFIYDNLSDDGTRDVVAGIQRTEPVQLIPWRFTDPHAQYKAYEHCIYNTRDLFDWVIFIDADEFVAMADGLSFRAMLERNADSNGIALNWSMFGSSGHITPPPGLVIENFTKRAPDDFPPNRHIKSIVRPKAAGLPTSPHTFAEIQYVSPSGVPVSWELTGVTASPPDYRICWLNHYFVRSRAHWEQKIARGYRDGVRRTEEFETYDRNELTDTEVATKGASVRRRMQSFYMYADTIAMVDRQKSCQFDVKWYTINYPDVRASGYEPSQHFWDCGLQEGRDPNPYFDSEWYSRKYLQTADWKRSAFAHYLSRGAREGLRPGP